MQNAWDLSCPTRPANLTIVAQENEHGHGHDEINSDPDDDEQFDDDLVSNQALNPRNVDQQDQLDLRSHKSLKARTSSPQDNFDENDRMRQHRQTCSAPTIQVVSSTSERQLEQIELEHELDFDRLMDNNKGNQRTDRRARKKDQNRRAALNYRRKKMEERNRVREEEMRLVYARVCLIGHADELESNINYLLETQCQKSMDKRGRLKALLCPLCQEPCDNIASMRRHLATWHQQWLDWSLNHSHNNDTDNTNNNNHLDPQVQQQQQHQDHSQQLYLQRPSSSFDHNQLIQQHITTKQPL